MSKPPWEMVEVVHDVVWSGEIMGIRVHVLENGKRVIDARDIEKLFGLAEGEGFDPVLFLAELNAAGGVS